MRYEYAIIVKNKTRLESLIERFNTKAQAKFYIERLGGNFEDYEIEHETFHNALISLQTQLSNHLSVYGVGYTAPSEKFDDIKKVADRKSVV